MPRRWLKVLFVGLQIAWMVAVLPGHVRGMIVMAPDRCCATEAEEADDAASCCAAEDEPYRPGDAPSPERQKRCAVCYQAMGYDLPPVFDVDVRPTGECLLVRPVSPQVCYHPPHRATYLANGPPAV